MCRLSFVFRPAWIYLCLLYTSFNTLMVSDGNGIRTGAEAAAVKVTATVVKQDKAKKIIVFKYKAKKNERKKQGHRQPFTAVKIEKIEL